MLKIKHCRLLMWFLPYLFVLVGFPASVWAMSVRLAWDPSPSTNVSGYRLYYKTGYSGWPYNGTGASEGNSPIDLLEATGLSDVTSFTVSGLDDNQIYYFVVTAYNAEAESGPSNEVSTAGDSGGGSDPVQGGSSSGSAAGGGGGGCFISAAADGCSKVLFAGLILPASLFVLSFRRVWRRIHR